MRKESGRFDRNPTLVWARSPFSTLFLDQQIRISQQISISTRFRVTALHDLFVARNTGLADRFARLADRFTGLARGATILLEANAFDFLFAADRFAGLHVAGFARGDFTRNTRLHIARRAGLARLTGLAGRTTILLEPNALGLLFAADRTSQGSHGVTSHGTHGFTSQGVQGWHGSQGLQEERRFFLNQTRLAFFLPQTGFFSPVLKRVAECGCGRAVLPQDQPHQPLHITQ